MNTDFKEEDMFPVIKELLQEKEYDVYAEVKDYDVVGILNDEIVIVEMKKNLSVKLLYQGLKGQRITDKVYIAYPKPKKMPLSKYREVTTVIKRLGLGLIIVDMSKLTGKIAVEPNYKPRVNKKRKEMLINEINGRNVSINIGGTTGKKINTSYRERCIKIACCLELIGIASAKELRSQFDCADDTYNILYRNVYGWFSKVEKGQYTLTKKAKKGLLDNQFIDVYNYYKEQLKQNG